MSDETEPKRLGGDLIASARDDAPSAASRARIAGAIGVGVAATVATTTATAATTTTTAAKLAGISLWTKVAGVAIVTLAVGGTAVAISQSDPPAPVTAPSAFVSKPSYDSARARHDEIPPPVAVPPVAEPEIDVAPLASAAASAVTAVGAVRTAPSTPPTEIETASPLAREIRSIELARSALGSGYPSLALKALDNHDREFPNGPMKTEADVLRVDALVASGDNAGAKRLATQLLARDPAGAHARHLKSVIGEK